MYLGISTLQRQLDYSRRPKSTAKYSFFDEHMLTCFREKKRQKEGFDLIHTVHEAELSHLKPVEPEHKFEVTLEPDKFTEEKFELFKDYQYNVHKEGPSDVTRPGFRRFLCESPLSRKEAGIDSKTKKLGSYHQCYRLDGRLIAMGVLDLLPHCVSGVYFLYHRDFEKWSFGKLSALREAALALEGGYEYYYMGYYIHSCQKMQYKGDYKPQYVLDPMTNSWHAMEEMKPLLDQNKFVSLDVLKKQKDKDTDAEMTPAPDAGADDSSDDDRFLGPDGTTWFYRDPATAGASGESLFKVRVPGVLTEEELRKEVDLDEICISLGHGVEVKTRQLNAWQDQTDITNSESLKGVIAEMAACVGPEVARSMAVDFSR
ncbi:Arginyl-tRNA--protein transferase-like protein [Elsinoe fawcettii]|nr:Arginyl-tRNA--protein transferase-like protein [Elsinoe fawcettii]